jgi:hypothetical protein
MTPIETVRSIYQNFGKQNIPAILETVSEDVEWEYAYGDSPIPWLKPRRGRAGVADFFQTLSLLEFKRFNVKTVLGEGNLVIGICEVEAVVRATGKSFVETDEVHIWHFDARGRVQRFRHCVDTLQEANALRP